MGCYMYNEDMAARTLSVEVGSVNFSRTFKVFIDDLNTPLAEIIAYPGVKPWQRHPESLWTYAQSFECSPAESAAVYNVVIKYSPKAPGQTPPEPEAPGQSRPFKLPGPVWSGGSESWQVPFQEDRNGNMVTNSAGVPFPDAVVDVYTRNLSLVMPVWDILTANVAINSALGRVNAAAWGGTGSQTWLCTSATWKHASLQFGDLGAVDYIETNFSFSCNPFTWNHYYVDRGYQQKADPVTGLPSTTGTSLIPCRGASGPVTEPVALRNGVQMSPPPSPTQRPDVLMFTPYPAVNFEPLFGNPF